MKRGNLKISVVVIFVAIAALAFVTPVSINHLRPNVALAVNGVGTVNPATGSATPVQAQTSPYACSIFSLATCIVYFSSYLITYIAGFFVSFAVWLIQLGLQFNQHVFDSPVVQTGFGIVLSLANLGFVLGIIIIALATILRRDNYGIKQTLWKLVVMAILVNFGLVIASPIVSFSTSLSQTFLKGMGDGTPNGFAGVMTQSFQVQNLLQPPTQSQAQASADSGVASTGFMQSVMSLIFDAIFSLIIVVTLLGLAALLLVRYCYLAGLLILLPFAWLAWVFPKYNGHFSKWWDDFIKWTFFPPLALFFIYLAIQTAGSSTYQQITGVSSNSAFPCPPNSTAQTCPTAAINATTNNGGAGNLPTVTQVVADDILLCALMIGGLFFAFSMAGKAGGVVVGQAQSWGKDIKGYASKKAKSSARTAGRAVGDRVKNAGKQYKGGETTTALQRFGSRLQGVPVLKYVPGVRNLGSTIARTTSPDALKKGREKDVQDYIDANLRGLDNKGIIDRAAAKTALLNPTQAAALAQELARRNLTTDPKIVGKMDDFVNAADRLGNLDKVTSNRPDLMPLRPGETREQATARAIRSAKGDIITVNSEIFNVTSPGTAATKLGPRITSGVLESAVLALSPAQLGALGADTTAGNQDRQNNIFAGVQKLIADFGLAKPIITPPPSGSPAGTTGTPTGKFELDTSALATAAATRPELKNLQNLLQRMKNDSNWLDPLNP